MSDTTTIDTSSHTDTIIPDAAHSGEQKVMGLFDESHGSVDEASAEVADAVATTIDKAKKSSAEALGTSKKLKAPKTPSKAMVAMKKGVDDMKASVTRPVKNVVNKIHTRAMDIVNKMRSGEKLSIKQASLVFLAPAGLAILASHYANMFSKRAQSAIEAGKAKWEGFLQSLGLSSDATTHDITQAEEAHHPEVKPAFTQVGEVGQVDPHHALSANDTPAPHTHGGTEHPGEEKQVA